MRKLTILLLLSVWTSLLNAQWVQTNGPEGCVIKSLAVSGSNLFAGTQAGGVFRSTDNGTSWTPASTGFTASTTVNAFALSGTNLFAGTGAGVLLSTNNGTSWTAASTGLTNTAIRSFAVSPNGAGGTNLFAGTNGGGVFLSADNGTGWSATGLTSIVVNALAVSPNGARGTNLFAGTNGGGVFLSADNGTSWTAVNAGLSNTTVRSLAVSATNLFAGTDDGVFLSTNDGTSWTAVGLASSSVRSFAISGANLFAGTDGGVFLSTDNGTSWTGVGLTNTAVNALAVSGTYLFAGADAGGVFRSTNSGASWTAVGLASASDRALAVIGTNLFAGTYGAGVFLSTDNGTSWNDANTGLTNHVLRALAVSGTNLFAGTNQGGVFLSTDNGASWAGAGLTNSTVCALAVSGTDLLAATWGDGVFRSTDDGNSWSVVGTGLLNIAVRALAVSGTDLLAGTDDGIFLLSNGTTNWKRIGLAGDTVWSIVVRGVNLFAGTNRSGVFLSSDNGTTWTGVNTGLTNTTVMTLAVCGTKLFAGTNGGVFLSTNDGTTWTGVGLANSIVRSFAFGSTYLFAGTHFDGVWRRPLPDIIHVTLAPGFSLEYFYRNNPRFDGIAPRGDGKLLVVVESGPNPGVYLATKGQSWSAADAYSSVGAPFNNPDDMVLDRTGAAYVVDNGSNLVIRVPAGGGTATAFVDASQVPTPNSFNPLGISIAPASFSGTNVSPGDLIVADNAFGNQDRAVWAIDPATGTVRGHPIKQGTDFLDGPLQVAFGLDGRLFVYENSSISGSGRIVTLDAAGTLTPFLTDIPGRGNLAIHPVTGDIFFSVSKPNIAGAKIMRIPAKISAPQMYPSSAVEVASGFNYLQDMEFSPDGQTLFVSACISTTWDILAISTSPQLTVDWYLTTPSGENHQFRGIAVDKTGSKVYICDSGTDLVYIYRNDGSNVPIGSFGNASWQTTMLGPYGIDASDDDYVYIAVWNNDDLNHDGQPDHSLWRCNLDGSNLTQLCLLPDAPRSLQVNGVGGNTVVYISGTWGNVIRCTPIASQQFSAQILYTTGIHQNQQDVIGNRAQSSIYVSSWYGSDSPYNDPVTKWNVAGQRDVGFSVGCALRGNTPGIDFDRSESALYLFNIDIVPTPSPSGIIADARLYKVDAVSGSGMSCVILGTSVVSVGQSVAGGGMNVGRDGKIYVSRTVCDNAGTSYSAWGRITDLSAATPPEFQAPAGTVSEVFAEGIVRPIGLAIDAQHRLFVAESGTGNIYRYESKTSKTLLANGFGEPFDIAIEGDILFVSDLVNGKIYQKDVSIGNPPFTMNSFTVIASSLSGPTYLIPGSGVGYAGKLFASMSGGALNGWVDQIDVSSGNTSTFMGIGGAGNVDPLGVVLAPSGEMYVCIQSTGKVLKIPSNATQPIEANALSSALEGLDSPAGIALGTDDRLYVATKDNIVVSRRDSKTWTPFVAGLSGGLYNNIEYAGNGELYIADYLGNRILRVALPKTQKAPVSFPLAYKINQTGHPNITDGSVFTAIQNAFQHWQDIPTCKASFQYSASTSSRYASMTDGVNLVTFTDDQFPFPPGVLAVVAKTLQMDPGQQTATIVDADIVFNPEFVSKTLWGLATDTYPGLPDSLTFDIESIATHEIGHILGLVHSGAPTSAMFFVLQPRKNGRTLQSDDAAWAGYQYPDGNFNTAYSSIEGKVIYGYDQSKPVAGALLIARNYSTGAYYHAYSDVNGDYHIPGLPAGNYHVLLRALNGKVFGYPLTPANVSAYLYAVTTITDYPGEWYDQGESSTDNPHDSTLVSVVAGQPTTGINLITNVDLTGPSVVGISPVNSALQVDVFSPVVITFSEAVDATTISGTSMTLSSSGGSVSGTYVLFNNKAVILTPLQPLNASTLYTVNVTGGVKDPKGNALSPTFTSTFTTGQTDLTAPTVAQIVPVRDSSGVFTTSPIYLRFSKRMDPATVTSSSLSVRDSAVAVVDPNSSIPGTITLTQDNTLATFTPSSTLSEGHTYKVSVTTQVKDAFGNAMLSAFTSGFTTVSGPPSWVTIGPSEGAYAVSVTSPILVDFSKSIDPTTVTSQSLSLTVDGSPVGGTFEFLKDNSRVIFRPSVSLLFSKQYHINISTDIADLSGNKLSASAHTTFTTAALLQAPIITSIDPPAATPGTTVVIAGGGFDPNPAKNTVSFNGIIAGASSSSSSSITSVVPDGAMAGVINVTVTVGGSSGAYLFDVLIPLLSPQDNIIAQAPTGSQPKNSGVTPDGALAFVTNFASNIVSVIGLASAQPTVGDPIIVGKNPYGIAITPNGKWAYVTNYGSNNVSVIDIATRTVISTIAVGMNPMGVDVSPDGSRIYVANSGSNFLSVIDGDPKSGAFNQVVAGASTQSSPKDVKVSPDGTLAFVTGGKSLLIIDINPTSASYNQIIGQASTSSQTKGVAVTPDGTTAIVTTNDGSILLINVYPKSPGFGQIIAGASTTSGANHPAPSPDGTRVYVTSQETNSVMVYDIAYTPGVPTGTVSGIVTTGITLKLVHTVQVGTAPDGIAIDPHNQKIVVVNSGSNAVSILSVAKTGELALETVNMLVTRIQTLIDKPGTSKQAADHLKKAQGALRDAARMIEGGDITHAFDQFRQAIHELKLASSPTLVVSDIITSLAQGADKLVQDAIKAAKAFPGSSPLNKQIADAEADVQRARAYVSSGDAENAMTSYKNAWDKAQLAIKLGQQTKGPNKPQSQDTEAEPTELSLGQNYPNPFNSTTQIMFDIPNTEIGGVFVELKVYNILGQVVRTLVNEIKTPGRYVVSWNGRRDDGRTSASGMYIVSFKAGKYQQARRVVLIQ